VRELTAHARLTRAAGILAVLGFTALMACGRADRVEVSAASASPPPAAAPPAADVSSFQGTVAAVDPASGDVTVRVQIVWTPVIKTDPQDRVVTVDGETQWVPARADLQVGEDLQVKARAAADGRWQALQIQLFDLD
jgi:Domain of unknown function (DUF5666)